MTVPSSLATRFRARYGGTPRVFRAPGRVNLIGEHTDYNEGLVMPVALDLSCWVAAAPRSDRTIVVHSDDLGKTAEMTIGSRQPPTHRWHDYAAGVVAVLDGHGVPLRGANLLVKSDVPLGAGLSSSAALEVAIATAVLDLAGATLDGTTLARLCQRAENDVVQAPCGIMDQYIAVHGRAGTALMLDCRTLEHQFVPLPSSLRIVACNSMVRHSIAGSQYRRRREECAAAVAALAARRPAITSLRDVDAADLELAKRELDDVLFRRVRHVLAENARVERAAAALRHQQLETLASLMWESHESLRDDYDVSCPELDTLVEIARSIPGVHGARMTGGGFGGCTVNLVHVDTVPDFTRIVAAAYEARTGRRPEIYVTSAADGAERVGR